MTTASQSPGYFDRLYDDNPDPWGFETRDYERAKYAVTVNVLPRERFVSVLEVGCSNGVLTEQISTRCDHILGIDIVDSALERARRRCSALSGVSFARSELPLRAPTGPFDLVLLSEVLYYFDEKEIEQIARTIALQLTSCAVFVLVHWLGPTPDYPLSGDSAVEAFEAAMSDIVVIQRQRTPEYRIDVFVRTV